MPDAKPECYQQFDEKASKLERIINTQYLEHTEAYIAAARAVLLDENGWVDYSKLNEDGTQNSFVAKMNEHYGTGARKWLGVDAGHNWDEIQTTMANSGVYGISTDQLLRIARQEGERFTLQGFSGLLNDPNGIMARIRATLEPVSYSHLNEADKGPMLEAIGLGGKLDPAATSMERIVNLSRFYRANGMVPERVYRNN